MPVDICNHRTRRF